MRAETGAGVFVVFWRLATPGCEKCSKPGSVSTVLSPSCSSASLTLSSSSASLLSLPGLSLSPSQAEPAYRRRY